MKWAQQSTGYFLTKPTFTVLQKLRGINPICLIIPWDNISVTPDNPTRKLEETFYQQHNLNFDYWMKLIQSTVNVITKPNVADIHKWRGITPMGLIDP